MPIAVLCVNADGSVHLAVRLCCRFDVATGVLVSMFVFVVLVVLLLLSLSSLFLLVVMANGDVTVSGVEILAARNTCRKQELAKVESKIPLHAPALISNQRRDRGDLQ